MRIERVTKDTIEIWSSLWQEQEKNIEGSFIRPMHKAYFQNKYQKTGKMKGYCVRKGEKAAAFFGTEYARQDGFCTVSFSDFIMTPQFRGKGIFTEMIKLIQAELFTDGEVLVFHPINRQAMISWKFALNPSATFRLDRFLVGMKKVEKADTTHFFLKEKQDPEQYLVKLSALKQGKIQAVLMVNEIRRDTIKGLEICEVSGLEEADLPELFTALFAWMTQEGYDFCMVKVSEHTPLQEWLEDLEAYQKEKEILYQFFVCDEALVPKIREWNPTVVGEVLDIPREDGLIKRFQEKIRDISSETEKNGGTHEG